jgi:hypothetical protein
VSGRRIPIGSLVGAVGALLLLVSLFLDWYGDLSAFTAFEVLDLVLATLALAALVVLAEPLGVGVWLPGVRPLWLGLGAAAVIVSQMVNQPPVADALRLELGAWLALAGALLVIVGSFPEGTRIALEVEVQEREPAAPDPDAPTVEQEEPRP